MADRKLSSDNEKLLPGDEDLTPDDAELASEFQELKTPRKKRKWLRRLFFFVALVVLITVSLFFLNRFGYVHLPISRYLQVEKIEQLLTGSRNTIAVEPKAAPRVILPPPAPPTPEETVKKPPLNAPPVAGKQYYLKVGSCLYQSCLNDFIRRMKAHKLPVVLQEQIQQTTYFELISDVNFSKKRAEEKLRLLHKYNETIGFPFLAEVQNHRYVISFGQFPKKSTAIQMKSHLQRLYPQIRMRFTLVPRRDQVTITALLAGPYNRAAAESLRMKLKDQADFEWVEIVNLRK